jgi:1,4-dihydroxy-2-naphthoyl-CoA hydrolase
VRVPETNMHEALGIEMAEAGDGVVTGRLAVTDAVRQPYGLVHGGAILTLAESLTSFGTWMGVKDDGKLAMGQEINASLMRPITEGHVNGTATVRRRGRTAWVWEVEITDDDDRLCALIRATIAVRDAPQ